MPIVAVLAAVSLLVLLIAVGKLHPFAAFLVSAILAAVLLGSPVEGVADSITRGIGDMLGSLTAILCLGAMFGRLVADSGAARQIADTLVGMAGDRWITLALSTAGFLVGIPLFYNVGFILMVPLIFSIARQAGKPVVYLAIPLLSGLSIAHGFLPPHPSPVALAGQFGANLGRTLVLGLVVGIPTLAIAGPLFALSLRGLVPQETGERHVQKDEAQDQLLPGILISFG